MTTFLDELNRRCTFAIISRPVTGKTTLTEKPLLFGGAIQFSTTRTARKSLRRLTQISRRRCAMGSSWWVSEVSHTFDFTDYRARWLTPVFFYSALTTFGVQEMLDGFIEQAPLPQPCAAIREHGLH